MVMVKKDEARENRIDNEIIVDAYGEEEHANGTIILKASSQSLSWQNALLKEQHLRC
jgi:hypothetical protein